MGEIAVKLLELCRSAAIECPRANQNDEVLSIAADSDHVTENTMFVCIRGLHTDGHLYIAEAVARGARWIVMEEGSRTDPIDGVVYLYASNTRRALSYLFHTWYGEPCKALKMIGVTGTNGKTSVTHMIRHILLQSGARCGLIGTLGCYLDDKNLCMQNEDPLANMTTPDPQMLYRVLSMMADCGAEYVVMEVSSHALALEKVAPIVFQVGIFTNLTPEHLDFHQTMEAYAEAKAKLMRQSKRIIVNADSPYADHMVAAARGEVICSSTVQHTDYAAEDICLSEEQTAYTLCHMEERIKLISPIGGSFTVDNSMQAAICAELLGIEKKTILSSIANLHGVKGRMERVKLPRVAEFTVWIDYAHTPDALQNLLCAAQKMRQSDGCIKLLFGCGGDRDRKKRPEMGRIASQYADVVVLTSDNSRSENKYEIIREILSGFSLETPCVILADRRRAITELITSAKRGDIILLAGKGHEEYEIDADGRRDFSEREIVQSAFAARIQH